MFLKFLIWSFFKIYCENSSLIQIGQEYMKTNILFQSYLAQLFLERKIFQTRVSEKLEIHILCSLTFVRKSCRLWNNLEKCCTAGQRIACWIPKATNTHTVSVILVAFPLQQSLHGRSAMLHYTYFSCLVLFAVLPICPYCMLHRFFLREWIKTVSEWVQCFWLSSGIVLHIGGMNSAAILSLFHASLCTK
jgi:hypothetical protein